MRATDPSRAIISREDVEKAQAIIDAWYEQIGPPLHHLRQRLDPPYLRGLITQALADAHAQGYDQGVARGRRIVANTVRDALDGEGL